MSLKVQILLTLAIIANIWVLPFHFRKFKCWKEWFLDGKQCQSRWIAKCLRHINSDWEVFRFDQGTIQWRYLWRTRNNVKPYGSMNCFQPKSISLLLYKSYLKNTEHELKAILHKSIHFKNYDILMIRKYWQMNCKIPKLHVHNGCWRKCFLSNQVRSNNCGVECTQNMYKH